jgi:hypothetical protein
MIVGSDDLTGTQDAVAQSLGTQEIQETLTQPDEEPSEPPGELGDDGGDRQRASDGGERQSSRVSGEVLSLNPHCRRSLL